MTFEEFIENISSQYDELESENLSKTIHNFFPIAGNNLVENIYFKIHDYAKDVFNFPPQDKCPNVFNSPPTEGCPKDGVDEKPSTEFDFSPHTKDCPNVFNSPPTEGCPKDGVGDKPSAEFDTSSPTKPYRIIKIHENIINLKPILNLPKNVNLGERAKKLRKAGNLPEVLFWMQVTKGNFHKIDFDRQRVIGNYIVDFYIKKLGLVIEIDGSSHDNKQEYDAIREAYLVSLGLKVYRIQVVDVMRNMNFVMMNLENYIIENYGERK